MAKTKYYAVKSGVTPGIYTTWDECQKNTKGFSGAIFKSFATREEAEQYLDNGSIRVNEKNDNAENITPQSEAVAYVDGSYNTATKEYAYGAVIFYNGNEEHFSEKFNDREMAKMRNVAGEIEGSKRAMRYCVENEIKSVDIYYDYQGIAAWCTGDWQAKQDGTIEYRKYYDSIKDKVRVNFIKVKAHTGDTYNELVDELAKNALGIKK